MMGKTSTELAPSGGPPTAVTTFQGAAGLERFDNEMEYAGGVCKRLNSFIDKNGLSITLGGQRYLPVEAWGFIASAFHVATVPAWTRPVKDENGKIIAWEARTELHDAEGRVIGAGDSITMVGEEQTTRKGAVIRKFTSHHEARSMAQTRSISRAVCNRFRFVAKMAGYKTTPAEEVPDGGFQDDEPIVVIDKPARPAAAKVSRPETMPENAEANRFSVLSISRKEGEKNGNVWRRYGVKVRDEIGAEIWLNTFSDTLADIARSAKDGGRQVMADYVRGEYRGKPTYDLVGIEILED